jgi:hypothetical protein
MKQESSVSIRITECLDSKDGFVRSVEGYIHLLPKCVCIANPIIQILFLIFATFLIRPLMKKD